MILQSFQTEDAYQGIAVDADYFYAINNTRISKHDKQTGELVATWDGSADLAEPLKHLDSGVVVEGELIAAHSNYPGLPMRSSIEIFDAGSLQFRSRHNFGVFLGSMTWLDRYEGVYWGAFGNYDIVPVGSFRPYGGTRNTVVVRFDEQFEVVQQWRLPDEIIARVSPMSNSGGSWGDDGYLYLTGHDHPEIYVMQVEDNNEELNWVATVQVPDLNGQGIAWDRSSEGRELWAIIRSNRQALRIRMPDFDVD